MQNGIVAPVTDTTAPSVPSGLSAAVISSSQINLSWSASTDNVGVTGYRIYRGGAQIATATGTSFSNTGLTPSTSYTYTVAAYDAAGNVSQQSSPVSKTTQISSGGGSLPLSASYSFEAQSGTTVADSSGNGNGGVSTSASWVAGKYGQGMSFAGTGFVSVPDAPSLDITGAGTVEVWVKPTTLGIWQGILAKGNQNSEAAHNYSLEIDAANRAVCSIGNGSTANTLTSVATLVAAQFTHLACIWDGTTVKLYVNGVLDTSAPQTITPLVNTSSLLLGKFGGDVDYAKSIIDEVRIYKAALSQPQVQTDMQNGIVAPPSPAGTYSISGKVSGSPATLTLSGTASGVTTTDSAGNHSFSGLNNGSYVIAPSQPGYAFTPSTTSMSINGASVAGVNFTATPLHSVSLTWTASTSPNIVGYTFYRATTSGGPYTKLNTSPMTATAYVDNNVAAGQTYFYVATAVDSNTIESTYSTQTNALVPTP